MSAVANNANVAPASGEAVSKMQPLSDFNLTDAGTGAQVSVAALAGSHDVVALDFFAPWCKACPAAAAELAALAKRFAGKTDAAFALVALECNEDDALEWTGRHGIEGVRLLVADEENLPDGAVPLGVKGLPHKTVLKGGKIFANGSDIDLSARFLEAAGHTVPSIAGEAVAQITIESAAAELSEAQQLAMTEGIPVGPSSQFYVKPPADFNVDEYRAFEKNEVVLRSNPGRWVMLPIKYPQIWEMYKKHEASFWTAEEIDLQSDLNDWENLTDNERHFLKHVLAFFAASDGIVLENLCSHFSTEVQLPEARAFYAFQAAMENIHSETYALLIETYLRNNEAEKNRLFNAIHTIPAVRKKAEWAVQWMCPESGCFAERLVAFAAVEGILFSGSFCALYFFKKRGLLPGLTFSNELIARDEGLHADFACLLYSMLEKKLPQSRVEQLVRGAVEVEREFICDALPCALIGMNNDLMTKYIEFVADRLLSSLGHKQVFHSTNPFSWMDMISLQGKTNFFEKRVGEYQKAGVMAGSEANNAFSLDEDF